MMDEVLPHALVEVPEAIEWDEAAEEAAKAGVIAGGDEAPGLTAH